MGFETEFEVWLSGALSATVPRNVKAFSFNLFEPVDEDMVKFSIELIGAGEFALDDPDWPCDEVWEPEERQLPIPIQYSGEEWESCLEKMTKLLTKELASDKSYSRKLKSREGVAIGFDDGDLEVLWWRASHNEEPHPTAKKQAEGKQKYYEILGKAAKALGVAYIKQEVPLDFPESIETADQWPAFELELTDGGYADYLANNIGWRLCSEKLMAILKEHVGTADHCMWLPVTVKDPQAGPERTYYVLHIGDSADVVNTSASITAGDFVVKAVLDGTKLGGHSIFSYSTGGGEWVVSEDAKLAVEKEQCTGMEFSEVRVQ